MTDRWLDGGRYKYEMGTGTAREMGVEQLKMIINENVCEGREKRKCTSRK
jgi:hypothetical protein